MKMPLLFKSLDEAVRGFWLALSIAVCVSFAVAVQMLLLYNRHERVVLMPPYVDRQMEIGWSSASADYLKSIGLYFVTLANSVTPTNVEFVKQAASTIVDARIYPGIRKRFEALAAEPAFMSTGHVSSFESQSLHYEPETSKVFVSGEVTGGGRSHRVGQTYEFVIVMRDGRPWILSADTYEGMTPHTLKWIAEHPPEQKDAGRETK